MAPISSYEIFDEGKILADYGRSGFNFENCRRYVTLNQEILICKIDLCIVISQQT